MATLPLQDVHSDAVLTPHSPHAQKVAQCREAEADMRRHIVIGLLGVTLMAGGRTVAHDWGFLCWKHLGYRLRQFGV